MLLFLLILFLPFKLDFNYFFGHTYRMLFSSCCFLFLPLLPSNIHHILLLLFSIEWSFFTFTNLSIVIHISIGCTWTDMCKELAHKKWLLIPYSVHLQYSLLLTQSAFFPLTSFIFLKESKIFNPTIWYSFSGSNIFFRIVS